MAASDGKFFLISNSNGNGYKRAGVVVRVRQVATAKMPAYFLARGGCHSLLFFRAMLPTHIFLITN